MSFRPPKLLLLGLGVVLALAGCTKPIHTQRMPARMAYRQAIANALDGDHYSAGTRVVLRRFDLEESFATEPKETLLRLHEKACVDDRRDLLCALAELNYLHATHVERIVKPWAIKNAPDYYLAAAVYAYLYLLGDTNQFIVSDIARQAQLARDLYSHALPKGLVAPKDPNGVVRLASGSRPLPPGQVELRLELTQFPWELTAFDRFLAADDWKVRGLTVVNRDPGLGSPLIGVRKAAEDEPVAQRVPVTVFLRVAGDASQWSAGQLVATLEVHSAYEKCSVEVGNFKVPLQTDTTTPQAHTLRDLSAWDWNLGRFFSPKDKIKPGIYLTQPYQAGRIPVVFVHGTASSPMWWGEMLNTLRADPVLRGQCQFWNFTYNTGYPIPLSADIFRESLTNIVNTLDPTGQDPALRRMVVIGHSQGGLLAKMVVIDPGDQLWRAVSDVRFDEAALKPRHRDLLRHAFFFEPVPVVARVVFICTPHRGSFRNTSLVRRLGALLIGLPNRVALSTADLLQLQKQLRIPREFMVSAPTSLEGMSPKNPWLLQLAELPPAHGVKAHSIIAVKDPDRLPDAHDGVVAFKSAHVPYVESELILRSGHSCQDQPPSIEEVRRILLEHLQAAPR